MSDTNQNNTTAAAIESILFIHGEPMTDAKIASVLGASSDDVAAGLAALRRRLDGGGLMLVEKEGEWQLATHPDCAAAVASLLKEQHTEALSRASLETLAVIAYKGPLTRAEVEHIRGVNSSFSIRTLLLRGLIERTEHDEDARSFVYAVSMDFFKYLGLARPADLPDYEELKKAASELSSASEPGPDASPEEQ